jgi:hypothetical protein
MTHGNRLRTYKRECPRAFSQTSAIQFQLCCSSVAAVACPVASAGDKDHYQAFLGVLIDLIVQLLGLIIKPFDNQTER